MDILTTLLLISKMPWKRYWFAKNLQNTFQNKKHQQKYSNRDFSVKNSKLTKKYRFEDITL